MNTFSHSINSLQNAFIKPIISDSSRDEVGSRMKESLATTLYDLARAKEFAPFSILFATGQWYDIKTSAHISIGPVSRLEAEKLKAVVVWDDAGQFRSIYLPAVVKVERKEQ